MVVLNVSCLHLCREEVNDGYIGRESCQLNDGHLGPHLSRHHGWIIDGPAVVTMWRRPLLKKIET